MLEYLEYQILAYNSTNVEFDQNNQTVVDIQSALDSTFYYIDLVRENSRLLVNANDASWKFETRMIAHYLLRLSKSSIIRAQASDYATNQASWIKFTPQAFTSAVFVEDVFLLQTSEYAVNPQQTSSPNISGNVLDIDMFNETTLNKAEIANVGAQFEVVFPVSENFNLTTFSSYYNLLKPYRDKDVSRMQEMIEIGKIKCVYWDGN